MSETKKTKKAGSVIGNIAAALFSFLVAMFLWYYVSENDTAQYESTVHSVPVTLKNNSPLSILSGNDLTVDVTVSGRKADVIALSAENISAYVEIETDTVAGKNKCNVMCDLPNGISLVSLSSSTVTVYLDNTATLSVPVTVAVTDIVIDSGYELGQAQSDVSSIWVTGPEAVVNTIAEARLTVSLGHVTKTVSCSGSVVLLDAQGNEVISPYIRHSVSTVNATVPVSKTREVEIGISFLHDIFNSQNCTVSVSPAFLKIKGDADAVDRVQLQYKIDEKALELSSDNTVERRISVSLPSGVTNVDGIDEIVVTVNASGIVTKTFSTSVQLINLPSGVTVTHKPTISVKIRGDRATVERLNSYNIIATADMSGAMAGDNVRTVTLSYSSFDGKVFEIGSYEVTVTVTGAAQ